MTDNTKNASTATDKNAGGTATVAKKNIIETATADGHFKTLATALKEAGLVETLQGAGPFTVFAPNDAAFEKLPKETLDGLLKDKTKLAKILKYHVVAGAVHAADLKKMADKDGKIEAKTVEGQPLKLHLDGVIAHLGADNKARVTRADVEASNGVIHVIDSVLMPPM